jgi:hypothetical protein
MVRLQPEPRPGIFRVLFDFLVLSWPGIGQISVDEYPVLGIS